MLDYLQRFFMESMLNPVDQAREALPRQLSVIALWLLMINGMIGAGIFGVPATAQRLVGSFSPWLFVICALLMAPIMLCFCQLSSAFSHTGGPVLYARTAFGPFAGFQAGWAFYLARLTAFAANLSLLVAALGYFWPESNGALLRVGLLLAITLLMIWINVVGSRAAMRSLGVITLLKLLPLLGLAIYGLSRLEIEHVSAVVSGPPLSDLGAALLVVIYAFVGFESGLVPGGEARQPQRDMPRALLFALAVSALLYALIQIAVQSLLPELPTSERPLVQAGQVLLGPVGALIVMFGLVASVGGNLLASMFSTSRISYRLSLDGQLPAWFGRIDPRHQTPANSIVCFGMLAFGLAVSGSFVWLAVLSVFTRLLLYLLCLASMPAVRRSAIAEANFIRLPGGWSLPLLATVICFGLLTQVGWKSVLATALMLAVGSVLYWLTTRSSAAARAAGA